MYAFVQYLDGEKSILPVRLIKKFQPASIDNLDPAVVKLAYWRSEAGTGENYYSANILMLGKTKDELIRRMQEGRKAIPRIIEGTKAHANSNNPGKEKRNLNAKKPPSGRGKGKSPLATGPAERELLVQELDQVESNNPSEEKRNLNAKKPPSGKGKGKSPLAPGPGERELLVQELDQLESNNPSEEKRNLNAKKPPSGKGKMKRSLATGPGEKDLLQKLDQLQVEKAELHKALAVLQAEVLAERELTRRLQDTLLDKIDLLIAHPAVLSAVEVIPQASSENIRPSVTFVEAVQEDDSQPLPPVLVEPTRKAPEQVPVMLPDTMPAQEEPVVLRGNDDDAEEFLNPDDMDALMSATTDSIFVRDASRSVWGDELKDRSLTGAPCRRFLKSGAVGKKALTPRKVKYVRRALATYIKAHPSPVVTGSMRLGQFKTHMRSLLADENRKTPRTAEK